jgi:2-C-methyl-D-erythritol 2,4-cyclodiphosphate synthase
MGETRVGLGFDVHRRAAGRTLMLGGVTFEGEDGLDGHSDGDVVCHAIGDAALGAAGLGDIGEHFPDTDPAFEGIPGGTLLERVVATLAERGLQVASVDVTVSAERPAIAPGRAALRERLAEILRLEVDRVSIKATRPEGLGLTGDGIGCLAIATLGPS